MFWHQTFLRSLVTLTVQGQDERSIVWVGLGAASGLLDAGMRACIPCRVLRREVRAVASAVQCSAAQCSRAAEKARPHVRASALCTPSGALYPHVRCTYPPKVMVLLS